MEHACIVFDNNVWDIIKQFLLYDKETYKNKTIDKIKKHIEHVYSLIYDDTYSFNIRYFPSFHDIQKKILKYNEQTALQVITVLTKIGNIGMYNNEDTCIKKDINIDFNSDKIKITYKYIFIKNTKIIFFINIDKYHTSFFK